MGKTWKAIFFCPYYSERIVWYVSSPYKARKMMNAQLCGVKRRLKRYRDMTEGVDYWLELTPLFETDPDIGVPDHAIR